MPLDLLCLLCLLFTLKRHVRLYITLSIDSSVTQHCIGARHDGHADLRQRILYDRIEAFRDI